MDNETAAAFRQCRARAQAHYENFPVASRLLPRNLRDPIAAIYVFARSADDWADEGACPAAERLAALDAMASNLEHSATGNPPDAAAWQALAAAMAQFRLPSAPFHDLLSAFRQDVVQSRYADFDDLRDYCRRSADPVGRLLLQLVGADSADNIEASDCICTALQLINFLQDIEQDFVDRDRLYIPQADLARHGVSEDMLRSRRAAPSIDRLLAEQIERAAALLYAGRWLPARMSGRLGMEVKLIVRGGWRTIERLREQKPGQALARPRLQRRDWAWILAGAFRQPALPARIAPLQQPTGD